MHPDNIGLARAYWNRIKAGTEPEVSQERLDQLTASAVKLVVSDDEGYRGELVKVIPAPSFTGLDRTSLDSVTDGLNIRRIRPYYILGDGTNEQVLRKDVESGEEIPVTREVRVDIMLNPETARTVYKQVDGVMEDGKIRRLRFAVKVLEPVDGVPQYSIGCFTDTYANLVTRGEAYDIEYNREDSANIAESFKVLDEMIKRIAG